MFVYAVNRVSEVVSNEIVVTALEPVLGVSVSSSVSL